MKIGILTKRYYTNKDLIKDRYGRLYHLPKQWVGLGAEVDVLALDYRNKASSEVVEGRLRLHSIPSNGFQLSSFEDTVLWGEYDVLVASGHLNLGWMVLSLAKKYRIPCVFDVYDYYPAFLGALHPIGVWLMRRMIGRFDGAMVVSAALDEFCRSSNEKICRIPNGVDVNRFQAVPQVRAREALSLETKIPIFGLFGSISDDLGRLEVLAAFRAFRRKYPEAQLVVGGDGSVFFNGVEGARSLGMLSHSELPVWASACDCLLIPYRKSLQVRYSQSARLAEYLALGKPIVVTRTGDAETWFPVDYAGWCEPSDHYSMACAMLAQYEQRASVAFPSRLRWENLGKASFEFIQSIVSDRSISGF